MKSQISSLTEMLQQQQISQSTQGKEQLEQVARREQAAAERAAEAEKREAAAAERVAAAAEQHRRELAAAMEEARQQRARDNARLDEMQRKLSAIELQNEARLEENQRLEEEARASERAQQERQEDYLRMQRALSLLGPSRTAAALTPVPAGILTPGRTPGGAGGAALSTPGASSAQRQRGAVSRQTPGSRANVDWLKGAMSPASGVDMLDRLEQRPSIANLPGPPRTPGLFFGCKR